MYVIHTKIYTELPMPYFLEHPDQEFPYMYIRKPIIFETFWPIGRKSLIHPVAKIIWQVLTLTGWSW